jgi:L-lactate dehydrogenase complex protein LldG
MIKACPHWNQVLSAANPGAHLFDEFEMRAKNAAAAVYRVKTTAEARETLLAFIKSVNAAKVVTVESALQQAAGISSALTSLGIMVCTDPREIAIHAETADIGISGVEFGIAESGSVFQDAYTIESRLVSTLPPVHVVFLNSSSIVPGIEDALNILSATYDHGYISFITGPSRTADIERVLTVGVHGPSRLIIIAVDEQVEGGALNWQENSAI